jgi:thioredoxin 1
MINRRQSLLSALAAASFLVAGAAHALTVKPFTPEAFQAAQASGAPVAVHFHADWCPTCRAQDKTLQGLASDDALKNVTVLRANYDTEKALKTQMKIRTQSTFVVFIGKEEVGRSAGETAAKDILATLTSRP